MKAFTDYPIVELGDKPSVEAPIREVVVISFDGNKYCKIEVAGIYTEIKAGYLYRTAGRCGHVQTINLKDLPVA